MELTVKDLYEFKACPLRYKFVKIDKLKVPLTKNDSIRECIESVINYFYFELQEGKLLGMEALKQKFSSMWYGDHAYDVFEDESRKKRQSELDAIGMLNVFHRSQKFKPDKVIASNLDFRIPFGDDFFITGNIPVIRDSPRGFEIANFKTGTHKYDEFWQKTDMGITIQAMAFQSIFKREVDSIAIHNLRDGSTHYVERKKKDYKRALKTIKMVKKSLEEGWLYPRESYKCSTCPAKKLCMEWR